MIAVTVRGIAPLKIARALCLAAAPVFAVMALLTAGNAPDMMCAHPSWVGGMAPMYALMAAVHAAPWLRLIARRGWRGRASSIKLGA